MELKNKTALIVNGDIALGYEISARLAQGGANVAVHYSGNAKKVTYTKDIPTAGGQTITTYRASLNDHQSVKSMMNDIKAQYKRIDILVYNAKPKKGNSLKSIDVEEWDRDIEEDLTGLYHCTKEISKIMVSQKSGKIIPVYFGIGARGEGELAGWSACTGGIAAFIKCLAMEFLRYKINVNGVAYGLIEEVDFPFMIKRTIKQYLNVLNITRAGTADDVAGAVYFLASKDSDYITGHNLYVNGGLLI